MSFIDKPMKADDYEEDKLRFPYLASPKLDGYRAFNYEGRIRTSSGTPVSNLFTQEQFRSRDHSGLDGELIVGAWNDKNAFHNTSGPVRRATGEPDVKWYIFDDRTDPDMPFVERYERAAERIKAMDHPRIVLVPHSIILTRVELDVYERQTVDEGFEGVMLRDPQGPYKFGRSTVNENYLLKVKRFISEEATIIGVEEQMENLGASDVDPLGRAKKSVSKDNQVGSGMAGAFLVRSDRWPEVFRISASSLSHKDRKHALEHPNEYLGELARFKYFPHGVVDAPRHGVFEAIRGREDS